MVRQRRMPRRCKVPKRPNNARKVGPPSTKKSGSPLRRRRSPPTRPTKRPRLGGQAGIADSRKSIGKPNRKYICLGVIILFFDFTLFLRSRYYAVRRRCPWPQKKKQRLLPSGSPLVLDEQWTGQPPLPADPVMVNRWRTRPVRQRPQPRLRPKKSILWKRKLQLLLMRLRLRMQLRQ